MKDKSFNSKYLPENQYRDASCLSAAELDACIERGEILQSTALTFDTERRLCLNVAGLRAYMPYEDCKQPGPGEEIKPIDVISRVGRPVCFMVKECKSSPAQFRESYIISRAAAQKACRENYISRLRRGDIIPCVVNSIAPFGAFCDIGCGITALLPVGSMSISRLCDPTDRVKVGQNLLCAVRSFNEYGQVALSMRELLGTWEQNVARFSVGETVVGIVRSVEDYGAFIEIAPNLCGLCEVDPALRPGQTVGVYIKSITPEKMKVKLSIVNKDIPHPVRFDLRYYQTAGHIQRWTFSPAISQKVIETVFDEEAGEA